MKINAMRRPRTPWVAAALVGLLLTSACGDTSASTNASSGSELDRDDEIAALVPEEIAETGVLRVATAIYAPAVMADSEGGDPTGWDISTIADVAALMGLEPEYSVIQFDGLVPGLEAGRYDVAVGEMAILPERVERLDFVQHHESGTAFLVADGDDLVASQVEDICGLTLAVLLGSSELEAAQQYSDECVAAGEEEITVSTYKDQPTANLAVTEGRADASLSSASQAAYIADESGGRLTVVENEFSEPIPVGIAIADTDYSAQMAEAVRAAVQELIDSGRRQEILDEFNGGLGNIETATIHSKDGV